MDYAHEFFSSSSGYGKRITHGDEIYSFEKILFERLWDVMLSLHSNKLISFAREMFRVSV